LVAREERGHCRERQFGAWVQPLPTSALAICFREALDRAGIRPNLNLPLGRTDSVGDRLRHEGLVSFREFSSWCH
jgi:hypothetical protein